MCHTCHTNQCTQARFTRADWTVLRPLLRKARREMSAEGGAYDVLYELVGSRFGWAFAGMLMGNAGGAKKYYRWKSHERQMKFLDLKIAVFERRTGRK